MAEKQMPDVSWKPIIMAPGPAEVSPETLAAVSMPPLPYFGRQWGRIYKETVELAKKPFGTRGDVILVPTPGSAALEMGIANLVPPKEKMLVIVNGYCGERIVEMGKHLQCEVITLEADYGEIVKPKELEEALKQYKDVKAVAVAHSDDSTGVRNPIKTYGKIIQENSNALFIVDATSSYGGMELSVDEWNIDYCVGHSGMAISGLAGITPIAISPEASRIIEERAWSPRAWFLDLKVWREYIDRMGVLGQPYPTEVPTHTILAFRSALKQAINEDLDKRYERHRLIAAAFRESVRAMGLECVAPEEYASSTVTVIRLPEGMSRKLIQGVLEKFNILLGRGVGKLEGKSIRVGHMGITASIHYVVYTITALAHTLRKLGFEAEEGVALEAFYSAMGEG